MSTQEHLFIGGRADGKKVQVPVNQRVFLLPDFRGPQAQFVAYRRTHWRGGETDFQIFLADGVSEDEAMRLLIEKYLP